MTRTVIHFLGDTKVGDLNTAFVINEDVCTFNIAVDNISFMKVVQSLKDLMDKVANERLFERAIIGEQGCNRSTWDVFEENVEVFIVEGGV